MDTELKEYLDKQFNNVDGEFKKINNTLEKHSSNFSAIDARFDKMDLKIDERFNTLDAKIDDRFNTLDTKIDERFNTLDVKIDESVESLARIIATTVAEPLERHIEDTRDYPTMRKDVTLLKHDVSEIQKVLHLKT